MTLRNSTFMHELPIHNRFPFFLYPAVSRFAVVGSSVLYIIPKDRKPVGVRQSSKSHGTPPPFRRYTTRHDASCLRRHGR